MCFSKYILWCCCLFIQLCPTLYDPTGCSPPGPSVHGILQARTLEWVPFPSPGSSQPRDWTCVFYVSCFHRQILYHWATSEAQAHLTVLHNLHLNPHIGKANSKVIYRCSAAWSISAHNPRAVQGSTVLTLLHVHSWDLYLDMARQRQVLLWREKTAKNPEGWDKHLFLENVITDCWPSGKCPVKIKEQDDKRCSKDCGAQAGPWWWSPNTKEHMGTEDRLHKGDSTVCWGLLVNANSWSCLRLLCWKKLSSQKRQMMLRMDNARRNGSLGRRHVFLLPWECSGETGRHRLTWTLGPGKIISNTQRKRKKTTKQFSG